MQNLLKRIFSYSKRRLWFSFNFSIYGNLGKKTFIDKPLKLEGTKNIFIGKKVLINKGVWLGSMPLTGNSKPVLQIKDGTTLGHFNHIYATNSIIIDENVLTADRVYISDNLHDYSDINMPIIQQQVIHKGDVHIGSGSWIGENVCIIGANIGKNCVIGANSVVTKDIPDYCVAVGAPAKIIKRYNVITNKWEKV